MKMKFMLIVFSIVMTMKVKAQMGSNSNYSDTCSEPKPVRVLGLCRAVASGDYDPQNKAEKVYLYERRLHALAFLAMVQANAQNSPGTVPDTCAAPDKNKIAALCLAIQ